MTVVATETEGAASFYEAFRAGKLVRLDRIATVATSLGALEVSEQALVYSRKQPTVPLVSHAAMQAGYHLEALCVMHRAGHQTADPALAMTRPAQRALTVVRDGAGGWWLCG